MSAPAERLEPGALRRGLRRGMILLAAWIPLGLLWVAFLIVDYGVPLQVAAWVAARNVGLAAVLGLGVWLLSGIVPWPRGPAWGFYGLQLFLAAAFSTLWLALSTPFALVSHEGAFRLLLTHYRPLGWRFAVGVWLYGLIAGVSYAVRVRRELAAQERAAAELKALATQARLDALIARVDPHFLFNALHSVSGLVHTRPEEAQAALEEIGSLLRYCLERAGASWVTLAEEVDFTKRYLALEGRRLGPRLRVEYDLEDAARASPVPPLVLQPLVENAVLHGIAPRPEGGSLVIRARRESDGVFLEVVNDCPTEVAASSGLGSGLETLRERLEALYVGRAHLIAGAATSPAAGFRVELFLPVVQSGAPESKPASRTGLH
jgi:hypothetical protein